GARPGPGRPTGRLRAKKKELDRARPGGAPPTRSQATQVPRAASPRGPGSSSLTPRAAGRDVPPMVRSVEKDREAAQRAAEGLIPVTPGPVSAQRKAVSTEQYWLDYYRTHDGQTKKKSASEALRETVGLLNASGKFRDVRAALIGFLTHHSK